MNIKSAAILAAAGRMQKFLILSAFLTDSDIILAHKEIAAKTNEIPMAQELILKLGLCYLNQFCTYVMWTTGPIKAFPKK